MMTRRETIAPLTWQHFPVDDKGFLRAPVLISGETEAILIDGAFNYGHGQAIADAVVASGKKLTTIYIAQSDPDFYFGNKPIHQAFPDARVIAAPAVVEAINGNVAKKLEVWSPKLGEYGPQSMEDLTIPTASDVTTLTVDGNDIHIVTADPGALPNRRYLYVPALKAVFGGVMVFAGLHVWTADTATPELRAAWIAALDEMAARNPAVVVAGHMAAGAATDASAIHHTRDYLVTFEDELAKAADSAALIAAMQARYPAAGLGIALEIGAKVAKGEMKWG
ncbi:MAG: MBL fold metallo-hydrolase [Rhodobacteraceae bacterium]|nr:MBL fold metallo-hydrolase [Paracoccaceae bacterium]